MTLTKQQLKNVSKWNDFEKIIVRNDSFLIKRTKSIINYNQK
jgi:hypothetical protein